MVLIATVALVGVTARLGFWQLDRAAQKMAIQTAIDDRRGLTELHTEDLANTSLAAAAQHYRRIALEGHWLGKHTIYLDNRPMSTRVGFVAVTPLALPDGTAVLVQRGWLPRDQLDRTRILPIATPEGVVRVAGLVSPPPGRLL